MPQSLSQLYIHLIFSTKNRIPIIKSEHLNVLHSYIGGILNNMKCDVIRVGGTSNHVHILFRLDKNISLSDAIRTIKTNSSRFIKSQSDCYEAFSWQDGYGAFSIGQSQMDNAIRYIENQEEHHKKKTFKEELLEFLKIYDVPYNEKYLWD